ncbi:uncharacterized protein [Palaemon carinicauda]|uniref:uncharacterized protein n=1 Tax=Palaemon carinicauda TaxID=392227 RepID=UPI0035B67F00
MQKFPIADLTLPVLSADFLSRFHLLVNVAHQWLGNADLYYSTPLHPAPSSFTLHTSAPMVAYAHFLTSYQKIFHSELCETPTVPAKHGIYCPIKMMGPVFARSRHLAQDPLAATKQTFVEMEEMGLCQKASIPWSSPLHIVLKKDASLSPFEDYKSLNMQTDPDHYPLQTLVSSCTK